MPGLFDLEAAGAKFPVTYSESMNTVLVQEMERFNRLIAVISTSLRSLKKAVKVRTGLPAVLARVSFCGECCVGLWRSASRHGVCGERGRDNFPLIDLDSFSKSD